MLYSQKMQNLVHDKPTVSLFGIKLDPLTMAEAVERLTDLLSKAPRQAQYVVTPNTDHVVMLQSDPVFREAYANAFMVVADGKPLIWTSRLLGVSLPETVPGSDLTPALLAALCAKRQRTKVFLFGAAPGVAVTAKARIEAQWGSSIEVVGATSPDFGFENDPALSDAYAEEIHRSGADVLIIGLGAPKQEVWTHRYGSKLNVKLVLCVGATIDFLAENRQRAPQWLRNSGLEWTHRIYQEPTRLGPRYAKDAALFPFIFLREAIRRITKD